MSKISASERSLNRISVQIRNAAQGETTTKYKRAKTLVDSGKARWIFHPVSEPKLPPTIAMRLDHHGCVEAAFAYDRINRSMTDQELIHTPVLMRRKLIEKGGDDRRMCGLLKRAKATVRVKSGIRCIE